MRIADVRAGLQARADLSQQRALGQRVVDHPEERSLAGRGLTTGLHRAGIVVLGPDKGDPPFGPGRRAGLTTVPGHPPASSTTARARAITTRDPPTSSIGPASTDTETVASVDPTAHSQASSVAPFAAA